MNRPTLIKAAAAVAATLAMIAAAPTLTDDSLAAMPSTWEIQRTVDAENTADSHEAALKAEKQRKKAAEKARAEARAKAERERRKAQARAARSARGGSPAQNRALGMQMCAARGWSSSQCSDLGTLWQRESGWSSSAHNSSSGAHGIPQSLPGSKMASHGSDWATNPRTQIAWGLDYIAGRYGNPSSALAHSNSVGWY